jgi:hypothetical protein
MEKSIIERTINMDNIHPHFRGWLILLPVTLVMLACIGLGSGTSTATVPQGSTGKATQAIGEATTTTGGATQTPAAEPDPLDRLLAMHSIQFNLIALQPDGTLNSVQGKIDSSGNMHLTFHSEASLPAGALENSDPEWLKQDYELYVVDGKAYQPDDQNATWMTTPVEENYGEELSNLLHGQDGPGLWLDILPDGSLQSAGQETVGGFATDKYSVNGAVDNQTITGNLWYETEGYALLKVTLTIPAALLLSNPSQKAQGELKITLETQKAEVPPVSLPTPPAGTAAPTSQTQPTQGSANSPPTTLSVSDRYPLPHTTFPGCGLLTTSGKVWVASISGFVDVLDAQSGQVLQSIALFPGAGGSAAQPVFDMKFDGQHIWVLAESQVGDRADTLFVIDPSSGTVIKQFDVSQWRGVINQQLGFSPGKIWTADHTIDIQTFEVTHVSWPWEAHYAYDGTGWMWITGSFCNHCNPVLWVFNADDLNQSHEGGYVNGNASGNPLTFTGERIWVVVSLDDSTTELWAYPPGGDKMTKDTKPLVMVSSPDDQPLALLEAGDSLWLLAGQENWGSLYQFDPQTGALLNQMVLVSVDDHTTFTVNIAFDGHDLWVLLAKELLRIPLK